MRTTHPSALLPGSPAVRPCGVTGPAVRASRASTGGATRKRRSAGSPWRDHRRVFCQALPILTPTSHTSLFLHSHQGTFGFVDLALDAETGAHVAVKFLDRGPSVNKAVLREILNHRLCAAHPHIVRFIEVFLTPRHLAIVMEYASGGDMFEWVLSHRVPGPGPTGLSEADARHFFQQLVVSVEFAHELGVANRDIKLENTLLDDAGVAAGAVRLPDVKICDFGYSKNEFVDSRPKSVSGTPDYIAPEVRVKKKDV